ncbi:hypothetical protein Fcan01_18886, partial [Folsomia candida]
LTRRPTNSNRCSSSSVSWTNSPQLPTPRTPSVEDEPDMAQVMTTLRILSQATISRRQQLPATSSTSVTCPNCQNQFVADKSYRQGVPNREGILENLRQMEVQLRSRGEALPAWVEAYRAGDTIKAAKLLHLSYTAGGRSALQRPRARHVLQEATSTTRTAEQEMPSSSGQDVSEGRNTDDERNKRIRLNSGKI